MQKPVIGVMPQYNWKEKKLMIMPDFFKAVALAGGVPVLLPLFSALADVEEILERFDGFLYPGGPDVNPLLFGEEAQPECGSIIPERDKLEIGLLPAILRSGRPVFGVCRGIQVMNVALGGTLYQDLAALDNREIRIGHFQKAGDEVLTHSVQVEKGTLLYDIVKKEKLLVNSFHHQACRKLGEGLIPNAVSPDKVVEAAALKNHRFFLGVQWHPEHLYQSEDMEKLWKAFVGSCYR